MPTLPPRVARVRAAYVRGAQGTNVCPTNSAKISDVTTCAAAASVDVTDVTTDAYAYYPSGCFLSGYNRRGHLGHSSSVYLNTHATGAASSDAKPLCAGAHPRPVAGAPEPRPRG